LVVSACTAPTGTGPGSSGGPGGKADDGTASKAGAVFENHPGDALCDAELQGMVEIQVGQVEGPRDRLDAYDAVEQALIERGIIEEGRPIPQNPSATSRWDTLSFSVGRQSPWAVHWPIDWEADGKPEATDVAYVTWGGHRVAQCKGDQMHNYVAPYCNPAVRWAAATARLDSIDDRRKTFEELKELGAVEGRYLPERLHREDDGTVHIQPMDEDNLSGSVKPAWSLTLSLGDEPVFEASELGLTQQATCPDFGGQRRSEPETRYTTEHDTDFAQTTIYPEGSDEPAMCIWHIDTHAEVPTQLAVRMGGCDGPGHAVLDAERGYVITDRLDAEQHGRMMRIFQALSSQVWEDYRALVSEPEAEPSDRCVWNGQLQAAGCLSAVLGTLFGGPWAPLALTAGAFSCGVNTAALDRDGCEPPGPGDAPNP
jgi:hypothetical protein